MYPVVTVMWEGARNKDPRNNGQGKKKGREPFFTRNKAVVAIVGVEIDKTARTGMRDSSWNHQ